MAQQIKLITSILILLVSFSICGQEICNNAIDDDGDGLIDLNDEEDCICPSTIPSGLIPNPSFEDMLCCPTQKEQLDCAVDWIQASAATSDYLHNCGITVHPGVGKSAPQPIPDGDGYVGFRDGLSSGSNYKEYVGACLNATMEVGTEYRLDFFLGFAPEVAQTIDMTVYGTTECSNIPFGGTSTTFGCPTNAPGWDQLGQLVVSGQGEWKNIIFDIIADKEYNVIVIGPGCNTQQNVNHAPYFFVDRLALAELADFDVPFAEIQGDLCQEGLTIVAEEDEDYGYQWFKDGIALIGETGISLDLEVDPASEGFYEVLITTSDGCFNSEDFELFVPVFETNLEASICEGESYPIAGSEITIAGPYTFPFTSVLGCDSLVYLDLEVTPVGAKFVSPQICEGEVYTYAGETYTEEGFYSLNTPGPAGCDSLISIELTVNSNYDINIPIEICEGETIQEGTETLTTTGIYPFNYSSITGCDSIVIIDLVVNEKYDETTNITICEGESYQLGSQLLTTSGVYGDILSTAAGCDSIINLDLEVVGIGTNFVSRQICEGEIYSYAGQSYTETGFYSFTNTGPSGCDSLISIDLTVNDKFDVIIPFNICEGDSFQEGSEILTATGMYTFDYSSTNGCDSIVTIDLIVNERYEETTTLTICEGETYQLGNQLLTDAGSYAEVLSSIAGCDSSVILDLVVENSTFSTPTEIICKGETFSILDDTYDSGGDYTLTTINEAGCDSIIFLELIVIDREDAIILPQDTLVLLGDPITISPEYRAPEILQIIWTDENGELSNDDILNIDQVIGRQEITVTGVDQYGCVEDDQIVIRVDRNVGIYPPNIFSPNGDGSNDYFRPEVNQSINALKEMMIYDRWGNLVYAEESIIDLNMWRGWDGKFNGSEAMAGVYVFIATFVALDGGEEVVSGDITIIR